MQVLVLIYILIHPRKRCDRELSDIKIAVGSSNIHLLHGLGVCAFSASASVFLAQHALATANQNLPWP